ncbi:GNAT family N-acetyltransferase [Polycladospora coralii]|uniref:GNAT family N-acetyltransferase n=1 Tax=Polycladospora coralii TaxID=2771432 RepID=UPI001CD14783|nr:GNAT family N-acetyltransferase [Polycladospora coralii]
MSYSVQVVSTQKQLEQAFSIRTAVFVAEQQVPHELEIDEWEQEATHFLLYQDSQKVLGTSRLRMLDEKTAKAERVAVLADARGLGAGKRLMHAMEKYARELGATQMVLNGQARVEKFYEQLGYRIVGEPFMDANIKHYHMEKRL